MDAKTFITELAGRLGRDTQEVTALCQELADILGETLAEGDSLVVPSFGSFEPKKREEHVALHPATGRKILIPPKLQVVFRPATALRNKVRSQEQDNESINE